MFCELLGAISCYPLVSFLEVKKNHLKKRITLLSGLGLYDIKDLFLNHYFSYLFIKFAPKIELQ